MIPLLAQQAVEHKIRHQLSVLLGNYEYYFACGLFSTLVPLSCDGSSRPEELAEEISHLAQDYQGKNRREQYLVYLLLRYEADPDAYTEQMKELFEMGKSSEVLTQSSE